MWEGRRRKVGSKGRFVCGLFGRVSSGQLSCENLMVLSWSGIFI